MVDSFQADTLTRALTCGLRIATHVTMRAIVDDHLSLDFSGQQGRISGVFSHARAHQGIRAAACLMASILCACAGAIRCSMLARTSGGAVSGEPAVKGGAGLYSRRS